MLDKIFGPLARRWSWVGTTLTVQKRFADVRGNYLAGAVALNIFIAIFPLLLVAIAILGLVTSNNADTAQRIIDNLGLTGNTATYVTDIVDSAADTKKAASIIGLAGLLWSGLGVVAAIEYALDATWQVTGRGIKDKVRGIIWGGGALLILGASVGLTTVVDVFADGVLLKLLTIVAAVAINVLFWMWTFNVLSFQRVDWHRYLPGALLAGIGLEAIKQLASIIPGGIVHTSPLYGPLGIVFAILATMVLFARLVVYASVLNVVKWEGAKGTVTVEVETPRMPGAVPLEADRAGAVEPEH